MKFNFESCIQVENRLYMIPYGKSLMYYDLENKSSHFVITDNKTYEKLNVVGKIHNLSDELIWITQNGERLGIYNILNNTIKAVEMPDITYRNWSSVVCSSILGDELIIVPKYDSFILKYNCITGEIMKKRVDYDNCVGCEGIDVAEIVDETLIGISNANDCLFLCDTRTGVVEKKLSLYGGIVSSSYINGREIYFLSSNGIWKYMVDTMELIRIFECKDISGMLIVEKDKIFVMPHLDTKILIYDMTSESITEYQNYPDDYSYDELNWYKYVSYSVSEDYIWLGSRCSNYMAAINRAEQEIEWMPSLDVCEKDDIISEIEKQEILHEKSSMSLRYLLSVLE